MRDALLSCQLFAKKERKKGKTREKKRFLIGFTLLILKYRKKERKNMEFSGPWQKVEQQNATGKMHGVQVNFYTILLNIGMVFASPVQTSLFLKYC